MGNKPYGSQEASRLPRAAASWPEEWAKRKQRRDAKKDCACRVRPPRSGITGTPKTSVVETVQVANERGPGNREPRRLYLGHRLRAFGSHLEYTHREPGNERNDDQNSPQQQPLTRDGPTLALRGFRRRGAWSRSAREQGITKQASHRHSGKVVDVD